MALRADGSQHQYCFTMDDQQGAALRGTALRNCTPPRRGCEGIIGIVKIIIMRILIREIEKVIKKMN